MLRSRYTWISRAGSSGTLGVLYRGVDEAALARAHRRHQPSTLARVRISSPPYTAEILQEKATLIGDAASALKMEITRTIIQLMLSKIL
jgi:hypothetical protein